VDEVAGHVDPELVEQLAAVRRWHETNPMLGLRGVRLLSVLPDELPAAIERLQGDAKEQQRSITGLESDLARYRADELAASAEEVRLKPDTTDTVETFRFVARAIDADANGLKSLATALVARPGLLVVLVSRSTPALLVIGRSAEVPISAQHLLTQLIAAFGGRGGGRPEMAQAGGLSATSDAILTAVRTLI